MLQFAEPRLSSERDLKPAVKHGGGSIMLMVTKTHVLA